MKLPVSLFLTLLMSCGQLLAGSLEDNIAYCNDCHGRDGVSLEQDIPTIAGFSATTISDMLFAYVDETRPAKASKFRLGDTSRAEIDMVTVAKKLSEDEIDALAEYYEKLPFIAAKQNFDTAKAEKGMQIHDERCVRCHDEGGSLPEDDSAILAGQWGPYLQQTFDNYLDGSRETDEEMLKAVKRLSPQKIEQLLHFYASLQGVE